MAGNDSKGRTTPIAEWAIRHASNLVNSARNAFRPPAGSYPPPAIVDQPATGSQQPPLQQVYRMTSAGTPAPRIEPWFGPGSPQRPMAPASDVAGRAFDYRNGENMSGRPRQYSGVSFEQLRGMADSLDIVRLCIETRKDQIGALTWSILPKQQPGEQMRAKADDRCLQLQKLFERPDGRMPWDTWVRELLEEMFVLDAPAVYVRRTLAGDVYSLEIVDGGTIKPLLDVTGRTPMSPMSAYQQILKGMPAINYTVDELLYMPRNRRANHVYGLSVVEQIIMTINIAIRREVTRLQYFTEGNIPELIIGVPEDWTPDQVAAWQRQWDNILSDSAARSRARFVPGKMVVQPTRSDAMLQGPFDEWIARIACFAFSLPPTAFVQQMNRATADTAQETALQEGLRPTMIWLKSFIDHIVQHVHGYDDLEMVYDDVQDMDVQVERQEDRADQQVGVLSIDEIRAKRGLDPIGIPNFIMGGPTGIIFLADLAKLYADGTTLQALRNALSPPPPPQFDEFGNPLPAPALPPIGGSPTPPPDPGSTAPPPAAPGGMPVQQAATRTVGLTGATDPLAGIPAAILAAVGLGPQGAAEAAAPITRQDEIAHDPGLAAVGQPQVLSTLRGVEALHRSRGKS